MSTYLCPPDRTLMLALAAHRIDPTYKVRDTALALRSLNNASRAAHGVPPVRMYISERRVSDAQRMLDWVESSDLYSGYLGFARHCTEAPADHPARALLSTLCELAEARAYSDRIANDQSK